MPNDAKLGLVVGVGLTIAVAVVFFSKEPQVSAETETSTGQLARQNDLPSTPPLLGREPTRAVGQVTGWQSER